MAGYEVMNPSAGILQGLQAGFAVQQNQFQQQQQALQVQAAQQAQQAAQAQQQALQSFYAIKSPTAKDYADIAARVPSMAENFKRVFDMRSKDQQETALRDVGQVYAALVNGKPEYAQQLIDDRIQVLRTANVDPNEIKTLEALSNIVKTDPEFAKKQAGLSLSFMPGGDKAITALATAGGEARANEMQPVAVAKATADAKTAAVTAKYAESNALADIEKKGWDIKAIQSDMEYKRESNRIAAMNAAISRESNGLKKQELQLKVQEAIDKREEKIREKVATAEGGASSIDNMLNTVQRVLKNPNLDAVVGGIDGRTPVVTDESIDAVALIETLGSQAFLAQIPAIKGMGALSNAEGEKLQSALQNLSRVQSEKQFRANLNEASRLLLKSRENLSKSSGVPLGKPDTPAAPGARPPLDSFNR